MTVPGGSPLNYRINSQSPIQRVAHAYPPTVNDYKNFQLGAEWLDTASKVWYKLADIAGKVAVWVLIGGTGAPLENFIPDSGTTPVVPDVNNQITLTGTNGLEVVGGVNTLTITHTNGEAATKFLPDSGTTPVVPDATGEVTLAGGTNLNTVGTLNTLTTNLDATITLTQVNATTFDTNVAAAGLTASGTTISTDGTDANISITMTPKGSGTVNPSALSVNSAFTFPTTDGTNEQVLQTDGAGVVTWENSGGGAVETINIQKFTASGVYTPTVGMQQCIVEMVGGGGGGAGADTEGGSGPYTGSNGGGGEYSKSIFPAATIGVSQAVTIGAGGTGGTNTPQTVGATGGTSSLGALITAIGGGGGQVRAPPGFTVGGIGGTGGTGDITFVGQAADDIISPASDSPVVFGASGGSVFGFGLPVKTTSNQVAPYGTGRTAPNYGVGGGGGMGTTIGVVPAVGHDGGVGSDGYMIITEYI